MMNIKANLLKNLIAVTVIFFMVGVGNVFGDDGFKKNLDEIIVRDINLEIAEKLESNNIKNSKLQTCKYMNGKIIEDKCKTIIKINDNEYYFGETSNGKYDGAGVYQVYYKVLSTSNNNRLTHIEGEVKWVYSGNWKNGKKHGYGNFIYIYQIYIYVCIHIKS